MMSFQDYLDSFQDICTTICTKNYRVCLGFTTLSCPWMYQFNGLVFAFLLPVVPTFESVLLTILLLLYTAEAEVHKALCLKSLWFKKHSLYIFSYKEVGNCSGKLMGRDGGGDDQYCTQTMAICKRKANQKEAVGSLVTYGGRQPGVALG